MVKMSSFLMKFYTKITLQKLETRNFVKNNHTIHFTPFLEKLMRKKLKFSYSAYGIHRLSDVFACRMTPKTFLTKK
jgi:hypothetical protein